MFKIFQGFHLVERLHQNKQNRRIERLPKHFVALVFTLAVTLTLWNMPIEMFGIPENTEPVALLVMGYPHPDAAPIEMHSTYRPIDEVVFYDSF